MENPATFPPSEDVREWTQTFLFDCLNRLLQARTAFVNLTESSSAAGDFLAAGPAYFDAEYLQKVYVDLLEVLQRHTSLPPLSGNSLERLEVTEPAQ